MSAEAPAEVPGLEDEAEREDAPYEGVIYARLCVRRGGFVGLACG